MGNLAKLCAALVVASVVLGGSSSAGHIGDAILQIASIALILVLFLDTSKADQPVTFRLPVVLSLLVLAVPLAQLVPWPSSVWHAVSHMQALDVAKDAARSAGLSANWKPLSITPDATWLSALSLLLPLAVFWTTLRLSYADRRSLSLVFLVAGVVSALLGLLQLAQGLKSPLRFYEYTNATEAVGFFANRNHFAALLYCVLVFAFAWTAQAAATRTEAPGGQVGARASAVVVASFVVLVILIASQIMARSRAGVGLSMLAIVAGLLISLSFRTERTSQVTVPRLLAAAAVLAFVFLTQFGLYRLMERFEIDPLADARIVFARNTWQAAKAFFPLGSGLGSFVRVYGLFEQPHDALPNIYANHAHNDIVELLLETGLAGAAVATLAGLCIMVSIVEAWRRPKPGVALIDTALARSGGTIIILLMLHSWFDYPLRTGAMMALFAFSCGLLTTPSERRASRTSGADDREAEPRLDLKGHSAARPVRAASRKSNVDTPPVSAAPSIAGVDTKHDQPAAETSKSGPQVSESWGKDIEWPSAWQPKGKPPGTKGD